MKQRYVCGFAFYDDNVVLIRKEKPDWQRGKLNGVGGKIEPFETPTQAMAREFNEEAGVLLPDDVWSIFAHLQFPEAEVFFMRACENRARYAITMESEKIEHRKASEIDRENVVPNLRWLIPLARHLEPERAVVVVNYEK